jgi:hypothetical protein
MNLETVKAFIDMRNDLREFGVIAASVYEGDALHLKAETILQFPNVEISKRGDGDSDYSYELKVEMEGIRFFALVRKEQVNIPEIAALIQPLEYMEEDIDFSEEIEIMKEDMRSEEYVSSFDLKLREGL